MKNVYLLWGGTVLHGIYTRREWAEEMRLILDPYKVPDSYDESKYHFRIEPRRLDEPLPPRQNP